MLEGSFKNDVTAGSLERLSKMETKCGKREKKSVTKYNNVTHSVFYADHLFHLFNLRILIPTLFCITFSFFN